MGVDIERYSHLGTYLNIHFFKTVFSENSEDTLARILFMRLNNEFLRHPFVAGTCRRA